MSALRLSYVNDQVEGKTPLSSFLLEDMVAVLVAKWREGHQAYQLIT